MWLSDTSVSRPVFAMVISILLVVFGLVSFDRLSLRQYPNVDRPVVSVRTDYTGASAAVVETRVTKVIEDRIAGIEGIRTITSTSRDGRSDINIEFQAGRPIDEAANDVRDQVSRVTGNLPEESSPPEVSKAAATSSTMMYIGLTSTEMSILELTDYARRYLVDRLSVVEGVARVRLIGELEYSMRIWLDREKLAARNLTVRDIETALRAENIELPAGNIESAQRDFTVRIERSYKTATDFAELVISQGDQGYLVRLGDVARVEVAPVESRRFSRVNGRPNVSMGVVPQSTANSLDVSNGVYARLDELRQSLPEHMELAVGYDRSTFVDSAINEVYRTLLIAALMVVVVIWVFLGDRRATLVPTVTVPVSIIATFIVLYAFGYTLNLLTLLALVLAIGLVVDDGIVVLENIHRRIRQGEPPLLAAYRGTRQVGFAVIATTLVLVAVFIPITLSQGSTGRLFGEFAVTLTAAVVLSSLVALTLCPVLCSKLLKKENSQTTADQNGKQRFSKMTGVYRKALAAVIARPRRMLVIYLFLAGLIALFYVKVPMEFVPREDRGVLMIFAQGPEGTSYEYNRKYMEQIQERLMPMVESGVIERLLISAPRHFGQGDTFNSGFIVLVPGDWSSGRPSVTELRTEVRKRIADISGVRAPVILPQGLRTGSRKPLSFVIGGGNYQDLAQWRDTLLDKIAENPKLSSVSHDYQETRPQLRVSIDRDRAGDLGVSVANISRTLETFLGSRKVTTFLYEGEQYNVILEGEKSHQRTALDMTNIFVRSERSQQLIPLANLVTISEMAGAESLNRYNRLRAITLEANLADGYSLGAALDFMDGLARDHLPAGVNVDYKGDSMEFRRAGEAGGFVFVLSLMVVFLVLAAQFESFIHPFVIMLAVPLAVLGALAGLYFTGQTLNLYSQIGILMLVGLAAKNGILLVEFVNQLRDQGMEFEEALIEACQVRLRPIVMTAITTVVGAIPLVMASGAGAETRYVLGVVVISGVAVATFFTLFVVPLAYRLFARNTGSPKAVSRKLEVEISAHQNQ
ncbi:efflux RND transporter permease subunit [Porticoccus sp. W117]|uniref:efflux RND transporter permease subunit n=1 Tax=Porticoccus sp. W117 TaxID=3054777 RepID=UPI002593A515|nr:efflux RND transporter permease subunit [Porticoccus sp. W117]MDM3870995.1 efflux RND transporter permease subunit [Porticoccus sp. W117]